MVMRVQSIQVFFSNYPFSSVTNVFCVHMVTATVFNSLLKKKMKHFFSPRLYSSASSKKCPNPYQKNVISVVYSKQKHVYCLYFF